jgi:hypothetical protein
VILVGNPVPVIVSWEPPLKLIPVLGVTDVTVNGIVILANPAFVSALPSASLTSTCHSPAAGVRAIVHLILVADFSLIWHAVPEIVTSTSAEMGRFSPSTSTMFPFRL